MLKAGPKASYRSSIHEESCLPAELLHRQLQESGLRDGPLIDVQSSLTMQEPEEKRRLLSNRETLKITVENIGTTVHIQPTASKKTSRLNLEF